MRASFLTFLAFFAAFVSGHSYLTKPEPRLYHSTWGCRIGGPPAPEDVEAGPCEAKYSANQPEVTAARGSPLRLEWPRNNHAGGFVRLAWVKTEESDLLDSHKRFDGNVQGYHCFETHCHADAGPGKVGGDTLGENGENPCYLDTTIPLHLTDGKWTLQWSWYGGDGGYLGDYYSCANYNIQGGPTGPQQEPYFMGGDVSYPDSQQCKYWTTNRLHYCKSEPCGDICNPNTAPAGHCGWPPVAGTPYIDPLINPATTTSSSTTSTTSSTTQATTSQPTTSTSPPGTSVPDGLPEIVVLVTVSLDMSPDVFDTVTFVYNIADILDIPIQAINRVEVDLDKSTDTLVVVRFEMINVMDKNGNMVDPVKKARELKTLADSNDPRLTEQYNLTGLKVLDATTLEESASNTITVTNVMFFVALFALLLF